MEHNKRKSYYNLEHQQRYKKKLKSKTINFNMENDIEAKLYEFLSTKPNINKYIKELIREEYDKNEE
ncbi:MAG: hypothetical protein ACK5LT_00425 [Lachnospirales bacterium]